jgi:quinoprotein relay system zinc metallohydrolase 2
MPLIPKHMPIIAPLWLITGWLLLNDVANAELPFNLTQPTPGVFVHLGQQVSAEAPGHDDIANLGFIVGKTCIAVIDTGGSVDVGRALRAAIRQHSALPICYVINTHVHFDHVLGNAAFADDHVSFVGSTLLATELKRSESFFFQNYGARKVIGPDRLVEKDLTLDLGGRRLSLKAWPTAHTDCDLTVVDEKTGTLWAGDLLFRERLPALDGSAKGWLAAIADLTRWQVKLTIPGHGTLARDLPAALAPEQHYLQALVDSIRVDLKQGISLQSALGEAADSERGTWLLWDEVHPRNVSRVYQELEWE